jgi:hypothetical protein
MPGDTYIPHRPARADDLAGRILTEGYAEVPVDRRFLQPRLEIIRAGMERITSDPALVKIFPWRMLEEDHYGKDYRQEVGLVLRKDDEHKWIFHYTPEAEFERIPAVHSDPDLMLFLEALHDLDIKGRQNALRFATSFDEKNPVLKAYSGSFAERVRNGRGITRILRYLRAFPGTADAFTHIDRGGITNHWGASHTGLYVYRPDGSRERVDETSNESVVLFPGRKFGAITKGKLGLGTPHGVKYDRAVDEDRYSFITFIHPASTKAEAAWLIERDAEIKAFEHTLRL